MSFLDTKYINLVSPQLGKFVRKNDKTYNFRCPYCGDSKKYKNKARGYLFKIKNDFVFKCHNCGVGRTFTNFLKDQSSILHDQYVMERYREGLTGKNTQTPEPKFEFKKPVFKRQQGVDLEKISELNTTHPAREYLEQRKIKDLEYFYYCPKFKDWTNKQKKIFNTLRQDSARIIIPLRDKDGTMFGYQGRSLAPKAKIRYITIMLDETKQKVFGLDRIDTTKDVYVTEGPFDSTFLGNSIAMCGSDVDLSSFDYRFVYVFDNEPRNREIVEKISKTADRGHRVVIFPNSIVEKDLNDMALAGHDVQHVVESNIYSGLEAKLKLNEWKKV
ncbi:DNA primase subunit [Synechococcus phage S-PM2]|uniref:DNA primase subunit n=1 Tax=Synechococcus phage S-PM2 TaxID=238854 RepID=Q5GQI8_BPSYP|nr:DNA primase [Synechococcus phage S-PM2]CAF34214.1 DNA primase subunit [Synechococcus phage S-PM2]CFW42338.1 DNA primase subunit [Synechococcus phage S-PM2]